MPAAGDTKGPPGNIKQGKSRVKNKEKNIEERVPHDGIEDKKENL